MSVSVRSGLEKTGNAMNAFIVGTAMKTGT